MQERNIPESRGNSDRAETNSVRHIRFSIETDRVREIAHEEQTENSKSFDYKQLSCTLCIQNVAKCI